MTFARFSPAPIGPGLLAHNNGLLVVADAGDINRTARLDIGKPADVDVQAGSEFVFFGEDPLQAVVGVITQSASLSTFVGGDAQGVGWRLDTGQIFSGNGILASGLPAVAKGEIVGIRIDAGTLRCYVGQTLVHSRPLPAGTWFPAISMAAAEAGGLSCVVNSGQWQRATPAGVWQAAPPAPVTLRVADANWLSSTGDDPSNARYEGVIDDAGLDVYDTLYFWPWGASPNAASTASVRLLDPEGRLDDLLDGDIAGQPVLIRSATQVLADALPIGRYVVASAEVESDSRKSLTLADAHEDLAQPLGRAVFLPNLPELAWQPQPVVIGAVANAPAYPLNADASVLYLADRPLQAVSVVRDRGDEMEPGTWQLAADGQQLLMQSPSIGPVACDVSSIGSDAAGPKPATLQQFLAECFRRLGKSAWSTADAAAIDAATGYAGIGFASTTATCWQAITAALASYGAWVWRDGSGVLRFSRVVAPEAALASNVAAEIHGEQLLRDAIRVDDRAPALSRRMAYRPNAYVHGVSDLVTDLVDVPPALRHRLQAPYWGQVYSDAAISPLYRHADTAEPMVSLFWRESDAAAELQRVLAMYAVARTTWRVELRDRSLDLQPGQVVRARYGRYASLADGPQLLVRSRQRNAITGDTTLHLWG